MAPFRKCLRSRKLDDRHGYEVISDSITLLQEVSSRKMISDISLYEIEIKEIDAASKRIKVHYTGYEEEFDEWKAITEDEEFPIAKYEKLPAKTSTTR